MFLDVTCDTAQKKSADVFSLFSRRVKIRTLPKREDRAYLLEAAAEAPVYKNIIGTLSLSFRIWPAPSAML